MSNDRDRQSASNTGSLVRWLKKVDGGGQVALNTAVLSSTFVFGPLALLIYPALFAGTVVVDGISAAVAAKRAVERRRFDDQERQRCLKEQAEWDRKEGERRKAEAEVARRNATPDYRRAEASRQYHGTLAQINGDDTLDGQGEQLSATWFGHGNLGG